MAKFKEGNSVNIKTVLLKIPEYQKMTAVAQKVRTYISKEGDKIAEKKIEEIINEGWKITCITPNGKVTIRTFSK